MKQTLLLLNFVCCLIIISSCENSKPKSIKVSAGINNKILGTPIKIDNLEVAQFDFQKIVTWGDAKNICDSLGNDWRMPNKDELNTLFLHKDRIGGFNGNWYWSSTVNENGDAWMQAFDNKIDGTGFIDKEIPLYLRVVRSK